MARNDDRQERRRRLSESESSDTFRESERRSERRSKRRRGRRRRLVADPAPASDATKIDGDGDGDGDAGQRHPEEEEEEEGEEGEGPGRSIAATSSSSSSSSSVSVSVSALAQATFPAWAWQTAVMVGLIFGGCCSNGFALEAIIKDQPQSGHLLTFAQFLFVAVEGFIHHLDVSPSSKEKRKTLLLKPTRIPIHRWFIQILLFFSVSMLNNFAFGYSISVPVHIILRSGGSVTTLAVGWLWGKRYTRIQVASVMILTVGIVLSAWGDSKEAESEKSTSRFLTGLGILLLAQVISAVMGLYVESTYRIYGNHYREGLFYMHFLSLPLFIPFARSVREQFTRLLESPPFLLPLPRRMRMRIGIPSQLAYLALNAATQYVCVRGVNMLASGSSALTVTVVLNVRKLVSLLLSMCVFGNRFGGGVALGAALVFGGGFMYAVGGAGAGGARRKG